jgi:protocatechuate 3,4-dioxygenase beta subunit
MHSGMKHLIDRFLRCTSYTLAVFAAFTSLANAEPKCAPTTQLAALHYPGAAAIPTTNNLILPTGKSVAAEAQQLVIRGRIVDSRCIPVQEAVVELWQRNPFGKWYLAEREDLATPGAIFAGAGRAITDSEGNFIFITGFPGAETYRARIKNKLVTVIRAPHVNIRIKAKGFQTVSTMLFFEGDRRNAGDPSYKALSVEKRSSVTMTMSQPDDETLVGSTQIVLSGKSPYQTY